MRLIDADKLTNKIDAYMINNQDVMFVRKLINEVTRSWTRKKGIE